MVCELYLNKVIKKKKNRQGVVLGPPETTACRNWKILIPLPAAGNLLENEAFLASHLL